MLLSFGEQLNKTAIAHRLSSSQRDFVARYVESLGRMYRRRDAAYDPERFDERRLSRKVSVYDLTYQLEEATERLENSRILRSRDVEDERKSFVYLGGYVDLLPFLMSPLGTASYIDVAYFRPSTVEGRAIHITANVLASLMNDLLPSVAVSRGRAPLESLTFRFTFEKVRRTLRFIRGDMRDIAFLRRTAPRGSAVVFAPQEPADPHSEDRLNEAVAVLRPSLAFLPFTPHASAAAQSESERRYGARWYNLDWDQPTRAWETGKAEELAA